MTMKTILRLLCPAVLALGTLGCQSMPLNPFADADPTTSQEDAIPEGLRIPETQGKSAYEAQQNANFQR
jgi:hypothetical protein